VIAGSATIEQIKSNYQSYAKKAVKGKEFMDKMGIGLGRTKIQAQMGW